MCWGWIFNFCKERKNMLTPTWTGTPSPDENSPITIEVGGLSWKVLKYWSTRSCSWSLLLLISFQGSINTKLTLLKLRVGIMMPKLMNLNFSLFYYCWFFILFRQACAYSCSLWACMGSLVKWSLWVRLVLWSVKRSSWSACRWISFYWVKFTCSWFWSFPLTWKLRWC